MMKKISERVLYEGKFLSLKESTHKTPKGETVRWESVSRKTKKIITVILAKLIPSQKYVLIRQFRPAINNFVLGLPAGFSESSHIKREAMRELREETGYIGKPKEASPPLKFSPALIDDEIRVVTAEIDEKDPRNKRPQQDLDPEEQIEVLLADKSKIKSLIKSEIKKGHDVAAGLWYLIMEVK